MPTWPATVSAARRLSPVSSTGRSPRRRSSATAAALVGLTVSATTTTPRTWPSQPTRIGVRPAASAASLAARRASSRCIDQSARKRSRPATTAWPSTTPVTPRPWLLAKLSTGASSSPASRAPAAMARAIGCSDASSSEPASRSSLVAVDAVGGHDVDEGHRAGGDGAGLVEHDRVDPPGRLEHLGALDDHAELGAAAGADHDRRRRGQAEGARAGDDQHGDGGGERHRRGPRRRRARTRAWRRRGR